MKLALHSCDSEVLKKSHNAFLSSLRVLAMEMGVTSHAIVKAPEQEFILHVLKKHSAEGLSTRELADYCGISIYKVRHLLLPLEKQGQVNRDKMLKHHRWFLSKNPTETTRYSSKGYFCLQQT
jgi:FaeA-like protein.